MVLLDPGPLKQFFNHVTAPRSLPSYKDEEEHETRRENGWIFFLLADHSHHHHRNHPERGGGGDLGLNVHCAKQLDWIH